MQPNFDKTPHFDPIKCIQKLESVGIPREQAEAQTAQLGHIVSIVNAHKVQKSDIILLEKSLKAHDREIAISLETKITLKIIEIEKQILSAESRLLKVILTSVFTAVGLTVSLLGVLIAYFS